MELLIRRYEDRDWPAVWALLRDTFRLGDTYAFAPDSSEAEIHRYWIELPRATFVACGPDGSVVGTYYLKPNQPGLGAHVCNCGYVVARLAQGQGIAAAMCEDSQQQARAAGFRAMQFNLVVATNVRAVRLWQRLGFEIVGTLRGAFCHAQLGDVDAHVMYKRLVEWSAPEFVAAPGSDAKGQMRVAGPADAVAISGLAILVFLSTYAADGLRADLTREALTTCGVAQVASALADTQQRLMLVESQGRLLAFSQLALAPSAANAAAPVGLELIRLYVHPAFRRRGLGRTLLAEAEAQCRILAQPLWLTAWSDNRRALDFYGALGFRDVGAKPYVFESQTYENRVLVKTFDTLDERRRG